MTAPDTDRAAVIVPGGGRSERSPLLAFSAVAVERRGGIVHRIEWKDRDKADWPAWPAASPRFSANLRTWVMTQVLSAIDETEVAIGGSAPVVIGRSLGSLAAPLVAKRRLPAVWFSPLLIDNLTASGLRAASAPCLLVGGAADPSWDTTVALSITDRVVTIDGADHAMFVPGELSSSASALGHVIAAVEQFLDQVVWPAGR